MKTTLFFLFSFVFFHFSFSQLNKLSGVPPIAFEKNSKVYLQLPEKDKKAEELTNLTNLENKIWDEDVLVFFPEQVSQNLIIQNGWVLYSAIQSPYDQTNWICLERTITGNNFNLFRYNTSTGVKKIMISNANSIGNYAFHPVCWSADKNSIFLERLEFDTSNEHEGIYRYDLSSEKLTELPISKKYMTTPLISPDRVYFTYLATSEEERELIHGDADKLMVYRIENGEELLLSQEIGVMHQVLGWYVNESFQKKLISNPPDNIAQLSFKLPWLTGLTYCVTRDGSNAPPAPIGSSSGCTNLGPHSYPAATDFDTPNNADHKVLAVAAGTVTSVVYSNSGYGNCIIITHSDNYRTRYAHNKSIAVSVGQQVQQGCYLAIEGTTGNSSGDHIHFEYETPGGGSNVYAYFTDCGGCVPHRGYNYTSANSLSPCTPAPPPNPTNLYISKPPTCADRSITFNWTNNSNNWNLDVTTDPGWGSWDVKFNLTGTSETGPSGFSGGLAFQPGVTYYWRIYDGSNFTYGPSFTMPNCDPLGHIDIYDCGSIEGWAFDPDYNNQSIDVHIYIDGFFAAALTTTHPRADVNSFFSITGVHGFIWNVPVSYQDANSHLIQVYAINVPSGNNPLIGTGNIGPCVPVNLQSSSNAICENDNVVLSWTNSGSSWYIDISTSPTFATYSNKVIPNVTSTNAPAGFSPAFTFQPNTVYYWRIWNGSGVHTVAPSSITVNPTPSAAVITVSDDSICPGFSTTIWASGSVGGTVDHNFYDAPSGGTLLGQDSITVSPPADFTYYLELINQFGCKSIPNPTAIPIVVNPVPSTPTVLAIPDSVCLGDTAQIVASGSTGGIVSYNFYSAASGGTLLGPAPLTESPPASTVYYLEAINQYGCIADTGRVPVLLTINPLPDDPTLVAGDISICYSDSTWLVANSATPNTSISWWNASTGGTVLVLGDTFSTPPLFTSEIYYTQAKSPEGCLNPGGRIPVNVTVNPLPIVTLSNDAVTLNSIFEGQIITFTADPPGLISYTFFLDSIPAQIAVSNTFPTNFIKDQQTVAVIATDINGCKNLYDDNMKIEVKPRSNAFTPNGDGINDLFLNGLEISIINRWGMVLYEGKNGWDGQNKGKNLPDGTYYYIIKLYNLSNEITQISGPVTLMR